MGKIVIFIASRHPTLRDGGSATYVRAWGRAAIRAGYEPHIFCAAATDRTEPTPYGTVHSAKTPFGPIRTILLPVHTRCIVRAIERFALSLGGKHLVHSFGCWGGVGVAAADRLARRGIKCVTVVTPFTTASHEGRGKLRGLCTAHGLRMEIRLHWEFAWSRLAVMRAAGRAAIAAGYEPHIFCVGETARVSATPCGIIHCIATPFRRYGA